MALEGNARDFGLSEIFQLISIQKKSGMLSVKADDEMSIFFCDGLIISTRDRRNRTKDPLKDYLLRYGFISRDDMNNLTQIQEESNMDLTDILLSEKYFSEDELKNIFMEQIYESVQEVLCWPKSHYKFIIGKNILSGVRSFASIKVEGILMESMRRIDEFPELRRIFSSESMRFTRLPFPAERGFSIGKDEEVIYELLETEKTLYDLIISSRMPRFSTYESLKQLLEKGLLEIKEDLKVISEEKEKSEPKIKVRGKPRLVPTLVTASILIAAFLTGEFLIPLLSPPGWKASRSGTASIEVPGNNALLAGNIDELRVRMLETTLSEALEEYYAARGSYPFTLEILATRKIVSGKVIDRAHQAGIIYKAFDSGSTYSISRK